MINLRPDPGRYGKAITWIEEGLSGGYVPLEMMLRSLRANLLMQYAADTWASSKGWIAWLMGTHQVGSHMGRDRTLSDTTKYHHHISYRFRPGLYIKGYTKNIGPEPQTQAISIDT